MLAGTMLVGRFNTIRYNISQTNIRYIYQYDYYYHYYYYYYYYSRDNVSRDNVSREIGRNIASRKTEVFLASAMRS